MPNVYLRSEKMLALRETANVKAALLERRFRLAGKPRLYARSARFYRSRAAAGKSAFGPAELDLRRKPRQSCLFI